MDELQVLKIQRFSTHDGPGIRTTVFLQGCPLHCVWCHNPESQSCSLGFFFQETNCIQCGKCAEVCPKSLHYWENGRHNVDRKHCVQCMKCTIVCPAKALEPISVKMGIDEILCMIEKDRSFYGNTGGLTLSGGEPLMWQKESIELCMAAKERNIGTAVETCGYFHSDNLPKLVENVDLFLWDLKDTDTNRHKENTGVYNDVILENLMEVDRLGGETVLRCIMLNGGNVNEAHFKEIAKIFSSLRHCRGVEIFSYHHYGESKYAALGTSYHGRKEWMVSKEELKKIRKYLVAQGVRCKIIE